MSLNPSRWSRSFERTVTPSGPRCRPDHETDRHSEGSEVLPVIEVAGSSLRYDRGAKLPRYAAAGILESWNPGS